jgi:hypothetical protein
VLLSTETTEYVAIAGAALGVLGLGFGSGAAWRLRRLRRAYAAVAKDAEGGELLPRIARTQTTVEELRREVADLRGDISLLRGDVADAIRHVAVVRYDAFDDMGGRLSFSAAMLDDAGDGLVLTSIHARSETRAYAKGIKAAKCELPLSPEEQQVIGYAIGSSSPKKPART